MDVCDGWSKKRGFLTAKAARLDSYRGANNILRMALDGKICLCFRPPHFHSKSGMCIIFDFSSIIKMYSHIFQIFGLSIQMSRKYYGSRENLMELLHLTLFLNWTILQMKNQTQIQASQIKLNIMLKNPQKMKMKVPMTKVAMKSRL